MSKLPLTYYQTSDTLSLSQDLLGKFLFTRLAGDTVTGGMIVETEAYLAPLDKASHAYNHRRTARTEVMFHLGGVSYVYLCYGMHHLFNIITHQENIPHAILIRAIEPVVGIEHMLTRCQRSHPAPLWTAGPALLTKALGLKREHTGIALDGTTIWLEDRGVKVSLEDCLASPRVGIAYAQEFAAMPWRFRIKDNAWTSPAK